MKPLKPEFITVDDFQNYWGKDLRVLLELQDNESYAAELFLARVERRVKRYINRHTFRRYKYEELYGAQLEAFQEALVVQAMYQWRNGDLGMDSGYDSERGKVIDKDELEEISICSDAINILSDAGLFNLTMKNRTRRFSGGLFSEELNGGPSWSGGNDK